MIKLFSGNYISGTGFYRSDLIKHHLIDYVVPFLPLEERHVEMCIEAELNRQGWMTTKLKEFNK